MRYARKHIEAFRGAGDGVGRQLAGKPGERHAVAREPLQIENIRREPSEIRRAAHGDVEIAAPGIRDFESASDGKTRTMRRRMDSARRGGCTEL